MKAQAVFHFLPTPQEYKGRALLLEVDETTLESLRAYVKGREKIAYVAQFEPYNLRSLPANARFHAILTRYAAHMKITLDTAKVQIKHDYGVCIPYIEGFVPPMREGVFVQIYNEIEFQVSTAVYTKAEMFHLMEGLEMTCAEAGVNYG